MWTYGVSVRSHAKDIAHFQEISCVGYVECSGSYPAPEIILWLYPPNEIW